VAFGFYDHFLVGNNRRIKGVAMPRLLDEIIYEGKKAIYLGQLESNNDYLICRLDSDEGRDVDLLKTYPNLLNIAVAFGYTKNLWWVVTSELRSMPCN
jgi:hypothetical protein